MVESVRTDIDKQEASRRIIGTAIRMYLHDEDAISTHLLAHAGNDIVRTVCNLRGIQSAFSLLTDRVRPEFNKQFIDASRRSYNYFKHAPDPDAVLDHFNEGMTAHTLLFAITDFQSAYKVVTPTMMVYQSWFISIHPHWFKMTWDQVEAASKTFPDMKQKTVSQQKQEGAALLDQLPRKIADEAIPHVDLMRRIQEVFTPSYTLNSRIPVSN